EHLGSVDAYVDVRAPRGEGQTREAAGEPYVRLRVAETAADEAPDVGRQRVKSHPCLARRLEQPSDRHVAYARGAGAGIAKRLQHALLVARSHRCERAAQRQAMG